MQIMIINFFMLMIDLELIKIGLKCHRNSRYVYIKNSDVTHKNNSLIQSWFCGFIIDFQSSRTLKILFQNQKYLHNKTACFKVKLN